MSMEEVWSQRRGVEHVADKPVYSDVRQKQSFQCRTNGRIQYQYAHQWH